MSRKFLKWTSLVLGATTVATTGAFLMIPKPSKFAKSLFKNPSGLNDSQIMEKFENLKSQLSGLAEGIKGSSIS